MKFLLSFIFCIGLFFQTTAQNKNYLSTNVSYAFFGTGDLSGTAIGLDYHRSLFGRFGIHAGYSKATGKGNSNLFGLNPNNAIGTNLEFNGNGSPSSNLANYQTFLLGVNYKVADGKRNVLLASVGANYKDIQNIYISNSTRTSIEGMTTLEVQNIILNAEKEVGLYFGLDYLYVFNNSITLGLHLAVENSSNIVSKTGLSLGFSF